MQPLSDSIFLRKVVFFSLFFLFLASIGFYFFTRDGEHNTQISNTSDDFKVLDPVNPVVRDDYTIESASRTLKELEESTIEIVSDREKGLLVIKKALLKPRNFLLENSEQRRNATIEAYNDIFDLKEKVSAGDTDSVVLSRLALAFDTIFAESCFNISWLQSSRWQEDGDLAEALMRAPDSHPHLAYFMFIEESYSKSFITRDKLMIGSHLLTLSRILDNFSEVLDNDQRKVYVDKTNQLLTRYATAPQTTLYGVRDIDDFYFINEANKSYAVATLAKFGDASAKKDALDNMRTTLEEFRKRLSGTSTPINFSTKNRLTLMYLGFLHEMGGENSKDELEDIISEFIDSEKSLTKELLATRNYLLGNAQSDMAIWDQYKQRALSAANSSPQFKDYLKSKGVSFPD